jgi:riboflavin kinase/FMN adenylyltransferase
MEIIRNFNQLRPKHRGCVATIGNFDGVHLGHQAVLKQLIQQAARLSCPATLISFEPQPLEFFAPQKAPVRLMRLREKWHILKNLALDRHLCLRFNADLANLSAAEFVRKVLIEGLAIKHLIVGDDFCFGKNRTGNFAFLQQAGQQAGFTVEAMPSVSLEEERVSSTRIRQCLARRDLEQVTRLLGRPYSLCGKVAHGEKLGRTLGFPTLNLALQREKAPLMGIYAVRVYGLGEHAIAGVASLGTRPSIKGIDPKPLLEVHLFDFDKMVYGQFVHVEFIHWLREEAHFSSLEALTVQIHQDAKQARELLIALPSEI